jgi:hypothetical protein
MAKGQLVSKDLTDKQFGRLQALKRVGKTPDGEVLWDCVCTCGNHKIIRGKSLRLGETKSCGCLRNEISGKRMALRPYEALYRKLLRRCDGGHKECNLSYEDFVAFMNITKCHYCGETVIWCKHHLGQKYYCGCNLDRRDNQKGYVKGNCLVCCGVCNGMKGTLEYDEFFNQIAKIVRQKGQNERNNSRNRG